MYLICTSVYANTNVLSNSLISVFALFRLFFFICTYCKATEIF